MKTSVFSLLLAFTAVLSLNAQVDPKAKAVLDKVSAKVKGYTSYKVSFSYELAMPNSQTPQKKEGELTVKGDKYYLSFAGQEIFCDGKNITTYNKANNEANVESTDDQEEDAITPTTILTLHEKGFKQKWVKEETTGGKKLTVIDLYPLEPKKKDFTIVTIYIDEAGSTVKKAVVKGRNGSTYTYTVKLLTPNVSVTDATFTFDKTKFPGVKVIK
ncbi:MAG: outer membrane lipoprotein carrier protein LolA [Bacteroidia bacterium]|nr:outer membrane lipoprotein carrier protein LolA [Bacteroidia bacterium]